jgi:hypothetical protein
MKSIQLALILVALGAIVFELDSIRRLKIAEAPPWRYQYQIVTSQHELIRNSFPAVEVLRLTQAGWELIHTFTTAGAKGVEVHAVLRKPESKEES